MKLLLLSDHLSRSYLDETSEELLPDVHITKYFNLPVTQETGKMIKDHTAKDEHLQALKNVMPQQQSALESDLRTYLTFRDEIKSNKIIIPKTLQSEMLHKLHESHQGIVKTKCRAKEALIGMSSDIKNKIK